MKDKCNMRFDDVRPNMVLVSRDPEFSYKKEDLIFIRSVENNSFIYDQLRCNTVKTRWTFYRDSHICFKKNWGERGTIFEDLDFIRSDEMQSFIKMVINIKESDAFFD